jgi:hypothetical protein
VNYFLWGIQIALAVGFLGSGFRKLATPIDALYRDVPTLRDLEEGFVRFLGAAEIVGGLCLVVPMAVNFVPELTPLAALALLAILVGAAGSHLRLGEVRQALTAGLLGLATAAVAMGRWALTQH